MGGLANAQRIGPLSGEAWPDFKRASTAPSQATCGRLRVATGPQRKWRAAGVLANSFCPEPLAGLRIAWVQWSSIRLAAPSSFFLIQ